MSSARLPVAVVQQAREPELAGNRDKIVRMTAEAAAKGARLVIFPEDALGSPVGTPDADIDAAAEVIAATVLLYYRFGGEGETHTHALILLMTYALAGLMVSNLKFYSFKESELYRRQPFGILVAVIVLLKLFIAEPQIMLFATFTLYAASGPVRWLFVRGKRLRGQMRRRPRKAPASGAAATEASTERQTRPLRRLVGLGTRPARKEGS